MPRGRDMEHHAEWKKFESREKDEKELWLEEYDWFIYDCAAGDLDGDGKAEAVGVSEDATLRVMKGDSGEVLWKLDEDFFYRAVLTCLITDVNDDGKNEVLCGGCDKKIHVFDGNGNEIWTFPSKKWIYTIKVADINGNGKKEVIFGSRDRKVHVVDFETRQELWQGQFEDQVRHLDVGDITGDGKLEIVATSTDQVLKVFDCEGNELWHHEFEDVDISGIDYRTGLFCLLGDINDDGKEEVIAGSEDGSLKVFDEHGNVLWEKKFSNVVHCAAVGDLTGDGKKEVLIGVDELKDGNNLLACDGTGKEIWTVTTDPVYCCTIGDITGDKNNEAIVGTANSRVLAFEGKIGKQIMEYKMDNYVRVVRLGDLDGDGVLEIICGGKDCTLRGVKYKP
ncbi:MAG: FG-GAP-like repeat-containing protein [Candidatus Helarchaeales archaeon]